LTGLAGEDEITDDRSVRQVEFARVCGSALRELHLGFRTSADPRNLTQRDASVISAQASWVAESLQGL